MVRSVESTLRPAWPGDRVWEWHDVGSEEHLVGQGGRALVRYGIAVRILSSFVH